jgi:hypothetical protein
MQHFLEPLLHDLAERFRFLEEEMANMQLPVEAEPCRQRIYRLVQIGKTRIDSILADPDVQRPEFAKNFYHTYKRLSELAQAVDEGPLFALSRFRDQDRFVTKVLGVVCQEFGFPYAAPICAAMSSQYYCAMTGMDLILVPHGEATHLLGWADLYHELAHFILARNQAALLQPLRRRVGEYFQTAIDDAMRAGWTSGAIQELNTYRTLWLGDWIVEFACDWFATFATGPSFAWSNLRLCARMSTDVFGIARTHPADAARTQPILEMLRLVPDLGEGHQVETRWQEFLGTIGGSEPQYFRIAYPHTLIRELATEVKQMFEASGLQAYNPGSKVVADLLNEAWKQFHADPAGFSAWESEQLQRLRKTLNLV